MFQKLLFFFQKCSNKKSLESSGGLVVSILDFHCKGLGSIPGQGTDPTKVHSMKKKFFELNIVELYLSICSIPYLYAQLCPTLCDPMNYNPPDSSVHGVFQARILEWVATSSSRGSSRPRDQTHVSCIAGRFFTTEPPGKPKYM